MSREAEKLKSLKVRVPAQNGIVPGNSTSDATISTAEYSQAKQRLKVALPLCTAALSLPSGTAAAAAAAAAAAGVYLLRNRREPGHRCP